jgi:hypothetical protein
VQRDWR